MTAADEMGDLVAEGIIARRAVPMHGGERFIGVRSNGVGTPAFGGIGDQQNPDIGLVLVAQGVELVELAVGGMLLLSVDRRIILEIGIVDALLVGETHADIGPRRLQRLICLEDSQIDERMDRIPRLDGGRDGPENHQIDRRIFFG